MAGPERRVCDVLVIGASASGVCAAVQAARTGLNTILCEPTYWVGGMLTAAGVSAFDGNDGLPSGMFGEFRSAVHDWYGGARAVRTGWVSETLFEPWVGQNILRGWISDCPSLEVHHLQQCLEVLVEGGRVEGAVFSSMLVRASVTVFADEYGDLVELAGLPWRTGLESRTETGEQLAPRYAHAIPQDVTWAATIKTPPSGFAAGLPEPVFSADDPLHQVRGEPELSWDEFLDYGRLPNDYVMLNFPTHDVGGNYLDSALRKEVLREAWERTNHLVTGLQTSFGKDRVVLPNIYPGHMAAIPYIREARRIRAVNTLHLEDLIDPMSSPLRSDAIAVGDYPVDHHRSNDGAAPLLQFPEVKAFSVPYGVMVPDSMDGLLVAEKSIGVTGLVNGCTRLQPVVMQLGQAAGLAASLCVGDGIEPRAVCVSRLQDELLERGGMLVPARDVPPSHSRFAELHRAVVRGTVNLRYESGGWTNRAYLEPDY